MTSDPTTTTELDGLEELSELVGWMDNHLDRDVADAYKDQPLAQDWARVAKVVEEAGEAVDALIGISGQNPRKGTYGSHQDLYDELCDTALTALYGLQHFVKNRHETVGLLLDRARYHRSRVEGAVLPPLKPIPGLNVNDPRELLSPEQRAELDADLERMARQRRTAGGNLD